MTEFYPDQVYRSLLPAMRPPGLSAHPDILQQQRTDGGRLGMTESVALGMGSVQNANLMRWLRALCAVFRVREWFPPRPTSGYRLPFDPLAPPRQSFAGVLLDLLLWLGIDALLWLVLSGELRRLYNLLMVRNFPSGSNDSSSTGEQASVFSQLFAAIDHLPLYIDRVKTALLKLVFNPALGASDVARSAAAAGAGGDVLNSTLGEEFRRQQQYRQQHGGLYPSRPYTGGGMGGGLLNGFSTLFGNLFTGGGSTSSASGARGTGGGVSGFLSGLTGLLGGLSGAAGPMSGRPYYGYDSSSSARYLPPGRGGFGSYFPGAASPYYGAPAYPYGDGGYPYSGGGDGYGYGSLPTSSFSSLGGGYRGAAAAAGPASPYYGRGMPGAAAAGYY